MRGLWLLLPLVATACGDAPTASLSVTCGEKLVLAGAQSIDVRGTTLSFPDPANAGQTNTISVADGRECQIKPVLDTVTNPGPH